MKINQAIFNFLMQAEAERAKGARLMRKENTTFTSAMRKHWKESELASNAAQSVLAATPHYAEANDSGNHYGISVSTGKCAIHGENALMIGLADHHEAVSECCISCLFNLIRDLFDEEYKPGMENFKQEED